MVGKYNIVIKNRYVTYTFEVKRKYTIIRGDSATGKTYMCNMLRDSSTQNSSDIRVSLLPYDNWEVILKGVSGQVFVVDESFKQINSKEFAGAMKYSDNYFILITREKLSCVPYSVREIYTLCSTKKYSNMQKAYTETTLLSVIGEEQISFTSDLIITEDSKSGYQFFKEVSKKAGVSCISANSNTNVIDVIKTNLNRYKTVCAIVDGAAFGYCLNDVFEMLGTLLNKRVFILAPESFEYLICRALPAICDKIYLDRTYDYCDLKHLSKIVNNGANVGVEPVDSWEQFYTRLLIGLTAGTEYNYTKSRLNPNIYRLRNKILKQLPELSFNQQK